ncbi:MAG TPA: hypothetical protein VJA21_07290 [Verrucomicrobiae bacterium]
MQVKKYKLRGLTVRDGQPSFINLSLEFEGARAFVIWDSMTLGCYLLKARLEIDPNLLLKDAGRDWDYMYRGKLVLPRPELN